MLDVILETLIDSVKLLPFLFLSYIIIEFIEHSSSDKMRKILFKSGKLGTLIGSILGIIPQCGFSVTASNLYAGRIISLGTLISVYLTTSDEAIPIMISHPEAYPALIKIIVLKFILGFIIGTIIDFILKNKEHKNSAISDINETTEHIHKLCENSKCNCEHDSILKSILSHTIKVFLFILIFAFILNTIIYLIGEDLLSKLLMNGTLLQPFIVALIGLIPNCASSILITELFIEGSITFASLLTGLLAGSGIGIAVLFKVNKDKKENLKILVLTYFLSVIVGIIFELVSIIF